MKATIKEIVGWACLILALILIISEPIYWAIHPHLTQMQLLWELWWVPIIAIFLLIIFMIFIVED